jgi:hypothetical protein
VRPSPAGIVPAGATGVKGTSADDAGAVMR